MKPGFHRDWMKSSFSNNGGASCVEVKFAGESVLLRDSKYLRDPSNPPASQPVIELPLSSWADFLDLAVGRRTQPVPGIRSLDHLVGGGVSITSTGGVRLNYTRAEWVAFTSGIQAGEFAAA
ncbi:MAG: DUF397 domain-containing protein [Nocardia sp.]|nr:DUF397 domain-containing protein [Nocardia sp.]